jgi:hypothetical protein
MNTVALLAWLLNLAACGGEATVPFRVSIDERGCPLGSGLPIELSLAAVQSEKLCLLGQSTLGPGSPEPRLDTGPNPAAREVVVVALVRSAASCVGCYGLLRVLLQPELTSYTLTLSAASGCAIPQSARDGLGLPAGPLPPTEPCR